MYDLTIFMCLSFILKLKFIVKRLIFLSVIGTDWIFEVEISFFIHSTIELSIILNEIIERIAHFTVLIWNYSMLTKADTRKRKTTSFLVLITVIENPIGDGIRQSWGQIFNLPLTGSYSLELCTWALDFSYVKQRSFIHNLLWLFQKINKELHVTCIKQCLAHRICVSVRFSYSSSFLLLLVRFHQQIPRVEDGTMRLFRGRGQNDYDRRNNNDQVPFLALPTPSHKQT